MTKANKQCYAFFACVRSTFCIHARRSFGAELNWCAVLCLFFVFLHLLEPRIKGEVCSLTLCAHREHARAAKKKEKRKGLMNNRLAVVWPGGAKWWCCRLLQQTILCGHVDDKPTHCVRYQRVRSFIASLIKAMIAPFVGRQQRIRCVLCLWSMSHRQNASHTHAPHTMRTILANIQHVNGLPSIYLLYK